MKSKIACLLALALTVTSLSACNMTSGKNPDDLRVDRDGGDYKHEYGDESETAVVTTTETTEETTEATTTTTTEETSSSATWAQKTISSFSDLCDVSVTALGNNFDTAYSIMESAFTSGFTLQNTEYHAAGEDYYEETLYIYYYGCDLNLDGFTFDTISFVCDENMSVCEISFIYRSSSSSELMNRYDYCRAEFEKMFGSPTSEQNDDDNILYEVFGPYNGNLCSAYYMYWSEDDAYNAAILTYNIDRRSE